MFKKFLIKQYIKFLNTSVLGKCINVIGKIAFGKMVFITGYNTNGKEFYKITTTRFLDQAHNKLKEAGYTELEEHRDFASIEGVMFNLAANRRRGS